MKKVFFFDEMLTPKIITFIYWIALFGVFITGIAMMFKFGRFSMSTFLLGIFTFLLGSIAVRVSFELMIIMFKIYENVKKIADK